MENIVYSIFRSMEERKDHLYLYLMGKYMILHGFHQGNNLLSYQECNLLQQPCMIKIVILYLSLERDIEIQLGYVHFLMQY